MSESVSVGSGTPRRPRLDDEARLTFSALADELVPAHGAFPSASAAGVAGENLDRALRVRPDLVDALRDLLHAVSGVDPYFAVTTLERYDKARFALLFETVVGAYVLNAAVQDELGYHGQQPKEIDSEAPDYLDLLPAVVDRGPIGRRP